jgi:hypothetical protein
MVENVGGLVIFDSCHEIRKPKLSVSMLFTDNLAYEQAVEESKWSL